MQDHRDLQPTNTTHMNNLADDVARMDRADLTEKLRGLQCDFTIDFSDEFLSAASIERLRHIYLAAALHAHNIMRQPA